jgi:hypothetical protein
MHRFAVKLCLAVVASAALTACSSGDPQLMNLPRSGQGPDEFLIVPNKPLTIPEDLAALPTPTPGGRNLAGATPREDMIAALGGNAAAETRGSGGLLAYAGRFGVDPSIREELAVADLEYRRQNDGRLLERVFNVSIYYEAYAPLSLDQYTELARFRQAGIPTPSAPPDPVIVNSLE